MYSEIGCKKYRWCTYRSSISRLDWLRIHNSHLEWPLEPGIQVVLDCPALGFGELTSGYAGRLLSASPLASSRLMSGRAERGWGVHAEKGGGGDFTGDGSSLSDDSLWLLPLPESLPSWRAHPCGHLLLAGRPAILKLSIIAQKVTDARY